MARGLKDCLIDSILALNTASFVQKLAEAAVPRNFADHEGYSGTS
jgi:hypothetical protein